MSTIKAVKGMPDILPENIHTWHYFEKTVAQIARHYTYREIRFPVVEPTSLFKRAVGEVTDIVEKEMYTFDDRNGESLSLRPEGTAGCVRAAIQHALLRQTQRIWYQGPMYRYERPQKGRQRQFHQVGFETFGWQTPDIDAELILLSAQLWKQLGIESAVNLELNSLGSLESRSHYKNELVNYFSDNKNLLDEDSLRRLDTNPLRILDSKNPDMQALNEKAPKLIDYLDDVSQQHFDQLCDLLDACGLQYTINPRLVRGLDYYNMTVFEWVTQQLGAQGTVCAGGRYDSLVQQLGGKPVPAVGMAMGVERILLLLETLALSPKTDRASDIYVIVQDDKQVQKQAYAWVKLIREQVPHLKLTMHCGGGSVKSQIKKADKSGAVIALIIGQQELQDNKITIKPMRDGKDVEQLVCAPDELATELNRLLKN